MQYIISSTMINDQLTMRNIKLLQTAKLDID